MATRNAPNTFTLEQFRVEFNELATDIGNVTGSSQGDQLNTTATDIVGAINEHESDIASLSQSFSITLAGDSGSNQTISTANTMTIAGGTGLDTVASATDTLTINIDSTVATLTGSQTLTNKTLTTPTLTTPIANAGIQLKNGATSAGFLEFFEDSDNGTNKVTLIGPASTADVTLTLPSATDTLVGKTTTDTLTNKTIDLASNTVTGSLAEFNSALQSDSFVSLTGSESLSNKTLTSPVVTSPTYTWTTKTNSDSPYTATAGDFLFINTSSGTVTVTLPSSASVGHTIKFKDLASSFATNNLTVGRNSHKIEGSASDLTVNNNGAGFTLVYSGATYGWLIQDV